LYFLLALAKFISPTQQLHYAIMSNQLLGGGEPVNRVCAVRRQERVGGVGFVTPQVIRPESPPQSLKIHRVPPSFPFPRNYQNAQNNLLRDFDGRPFLNTPPLSSQVPRTALGNAFDTLAAYGASGIKGGWGSPNMTFAFFRTCLAGSQVSRVPVDKRQCYDTLASASMQTALFLLEFLEFKKGLPPHVPRSFMA